jgi:hypothetical protein
MTANHTTRWLIRRDMKAALEFPAMLPEWTQGDLRRHHQQRNGIALVCEDSERRIVGWITYTLHRSHVAICNVATDDWEAEPAIALMQTLLNKMGDRRDLITLECPADQDDILVFFRSCGFAVWQQVNDMIYMRYDLPISTELTEIGGEVCRRSTGYPCMLPEGF